MSSDEFFDDGFVKVADCNHSHQIRTIPVSVKLLDAFRLAVLNDLGQTDRNTVRITRTLEHHRKYLFCVTHPCPTSRTPFFEHDATFLLNLCRIKRNVVCPVFENLKRTSHC